MRRDDFEPGRGQRAEQPGTAADREVELDPARGQVPLPVGTSPVRWTQTVRTTSASAGTGRRSTYSVTLVPKRSRESAVKALSTLAELRQKRRE
ncbi:hypothetical protein AB0M80_03655 [Amycolatopsis sp. NPDC051045]|uniref:hypothetical protein n=1 Tax=Amycolatopsis sp. NPDC051045 TaxID=3156922 RepID=UPI00343CBB5D